MDAARSSAMSIRPPSAWSPRAARSGASRTRPTSSRPSGTRSRPSRPRATQVPTTWDELIALSDKIVADGCNPWCVSAGGPGDATGWQITDWVEEVVLKTKGLQYYNDWISHKVTFEDPGIKDAFDKCRQDLLHARTMSSAATRPSSPPTRRRRWTRCSTEDLASPKCWMQKIPTWYGPDFFPDQRASGHAVEVHHRH